MTLEDVVREIAATRVTERGETRADDRMSVAAMEDRKREGYFKSARRPARAAASPPPAPSTTARAR